MADTDLELITRLAGAIFGDDTVRRLASEEGIAELRDEVREDIDPEMETVMVAPDYAGPQGILTYRGPDGFVEAWREWIEPYESYSVEVNELEVGPEGHVLTLGEQRGLTRTGGVEVREPAAAVFTVRDGRLLRAEFHLDPEKARRAAGIE